MREDVSLLFAECHHQLSRVRDADRPTAKLERFMDAYRSFVSLHDALGVSSPTVGNRRVTAQQLRDAVTADELGTEWDPGAFRKRVSMLEDELHALEQAHSNGLRGREQQLPRGHEPRQPAEWSHN